MTKTTRSLTRVLPLVLTLAGAGLASTATALEAADASKASGGLEINSRIATLTAFIEAVDSVYAIASDPDKAAILELHQLEDVYRGNEEAFVALLQEVARQAPTAAVRNVAYVKLSELYKKQGDRLAAAEVLKTALRKNMEEAGKR